MCLWSSAGMIIFGDNTEYTIEFLQQENNFLVEAEAFTLKNDNNSLTVTFSSGRLSDLSLLKHHLFSV